METVGARSGWGATLLTVALALGCAGCNDVPLAGVLDSFSAQVRDERSNTDAVKLDILWVIDDSVSMCQEQNALAANVQKFLGKIGSLVNVDVRLAVVTMDALSEKERGRFHHALPKPFPPNCLERRVEVCLADADCEAAMGDSADPSAWRCEAPSLGAAYLRNCNGSVNSSCRFRCGETADCCAEFQPGVPAEECTYQCVAPGGDESLRGCLQPPSVQGCPATLPEFVDAGVAAAEGRSIGDLFRCMAVVGARQDKKTQLEQGLLTATLALDPRGPHADQAQRFVRQDGYQVIIFVSDEEDCSVSQDMPAFFRGSSGTLVAEKWQKCGLLGDTDGKGPMGEDIETSELVPESFKDPSTYRGPLEPVSTFINKLRGINSDPSRVLVAAIVGDVVMTANGRPAPSSDPSAALKCPDTWVEGVSPPCEQGDIADCPTRKIDSYLRAKGGPGPLAASAYLCESDVGQADWGGRYLQVAKAFGQNGAVTNICSDGGFDEALDRIADTILRRVVRICLDEPVKSDTGITVTKTFEDGTVKSLSEGTDADYVLRAADDCAAGQAIFFNDVLAPNQKVNVTYEAPIYQPH